MKTPDLTEPCAQCNGTGRQLNQRAIGSLMRSRRKAANLTLKDVARKLKISGPYLSDLEQGKRRWTETRQKQFEKVTEKGGSK